MTTTVKELRRSYPDCLTAIGYVEMFLCIPCEGEEESTWTILTKEINGVRRTPNQIIGNIHFLLEVEITNPNNELPRKVIESILQQIEVPKFYTYIKGKMGAV